MLRQGIIDFVTFRNSIFTIFKKSEGLIKKKNFHKNMLGDSKWIWIPYEQTSQHSRTIHKINNEKLLFKSSCPWWLSIISACKIYISKLENNFFKGICFTRFERCLRYSSIRSSKSWSGLRVYSSPSS